MGLIGSSAQQIPTKYNGIHTTESIFGTSIPILFGQNRISWKLLWYGNFQATKAKQPGGSGLGKAGSQYVYSAAVLGMLCHGACNGLLATWDSLGKFALDGGSESFTPTTSNQTYTVLNASIYAQDAGVGRIQNYDVMVKDYGSPDPAPVQTSGTQTIPLQPVPVGTTPGPGQYTVNVASGTYTFSAADAGAALVINYQSYRYQIIEEELASVPFNPPYRVVVENQPYWKQDMGVQFFPSGLALTPVSGTPTVSGTYNPNGGTYEFAAVDAGKGITINYRFQDINTDANAPNTLNLIFFNGAKGQPVWSFLESNYPSQALGYSGLCMVGSQSIYMGYQPALPQYNFEIAGLYQVGGGIVDSNPADCIQSILCDPTFGIGFPVAYLQDGINSPGTIGTTNPLTIINSTFASGGNPPTGWQFEGSPTFSYDTTTAYGGTNQSPKLTATDRVIGMRVIAKYYMKAGTTVQLSAATKWISGGMQPVVRVAFYNTADQWLSATNDVMTLARSGNTWQTGTSSGVAPYATYYALVFTDCVYVKGGSASATTWKSTMCSCRP